MMASTFTCRALAGVGAAVMPSEISVWNSQISRLSLSLPSVRATADGGAGLAGDPKLNIFTEQLLQIAHLAGDPKRKG